MNDVHPIDNLNGSGNGSNSQPPLEMNNSMEVSNHDQQHPNNTNNNGSNNNSNNGNATTSTNATTSNNNNNNNNSNEAMIGSAHLRPVFMGNLDYNCTAEDLEDLFVRPHRGFEPMPIDRVDLKRGYAFVFFQEARTQNDKDRLERYVDEINGMDIAKISKQLPPNSPDDVHPIDNLNGSGNGSNSQPPLEMNNSMEVSNHDQQHPNNTNNNGSNNNSNNGNATTSTNATTSNNNNNNSNEAMIGSAHLRPVFMGNLDYNCTAEDLEDLFVRPHRGFEPMPIDRVDLKRGYAFVFFQEARTQNDKDRLERYVDEINGM
eukprot:CAMPEP_0203683180 /NCGR_PEP_ID=MMETSP0090-20130426/47386_1 /ASSEMBLY_ACC=CAM_ASM_001088 /TAXON_ID=426623 /ORGANISM="Chaetoceros affinis, Strain CCMP159" /LENGTH=317 /DNA_ID=CAMNT_0050552309 /DNA_START=97 /DNA_END=1051 /DNA_ORIENTATION=-